MFSSRLQLVGFVAFLLLTINAQRCALAEHTVARIWDEQLLHAISIDTARPTVHARICLVYRQQLYDAWGSLRHNGAAVCSSREGYRGGCRCRPKASHQLRRV